MTEQKTDISACIDRIEEIEHSLVRNMEDLKDSLNDFYDVLYKAPNDDLNQLINAGFVPGARYVFGGELNLKLVGYTFLRMDFLYENDNRHIYADLDAIVKRIELFKKVED